MSLVLVTGAAGFIGFHLSKLLSARGDEVLGLDNVNDYYDVSLKEARLAELQTLPNFRFVKRDLSDQEAIAGVFSEYMPECVVNLAAQAGVRYSLVNPAAYIQSNITGFLNILEGCRRHPVRHLVYASSSSVYGANKKQPFSVHDGVDHPISLYATSKRSNELMAHTYSHLFGIPTTGLRFFTVYGPWGRPDMALFAFTRAILAGRPIEVYNYGNMQRDFTYVDDIVEGVARVLDRPPRPDPDWNPPDFDPASSSAPFRLYNIGNKSPVDLMHFIETLEKYLGKTAEKHLLPMQPGDVVCTEADVEDLIRDTGFCPDTPVEVGIARFVEWYRAYYQV